MVAMQRLRDPVPIASESFCFKVELHLVGSDV